MYPTMNPNLNPGTLTGLLDDLTGFVTDSQELLSLFVGQIWEYLQMLPIFLTVVPLVIGVPLFLLLILQLVKVVLYGG